MTIKPTEAIGVVIVHWTVINYFYLYIETQQSPIILSKANITSTKRSYLFGDFRKIQSMTTIYNTTVYIKPKSGDDSFG